MLDANRNGLDLLQIFHMQIGAKRFFVVGGGGGGGLAALEHAALSFFHSSICLCWFLLLFFSVVAWMLFCAAAIFCAKFFDANKIAREKKAKRSEKLRNGKNDNDKRELGMFERRNERKSRREDKEMNYCLIQ